MGFQYLNALTTTWQLVLASASISTITIVGMKAAAVVLFALAYITSFGGVITGIGLLQSAGPFSREQAEKAFHDTAVGQSIGANISPLVEELFSLAVLSTGARPCTSSCATACLCLRLVLTCEWACW